MYTLLLILNIVGLWYADTTGYDFISERRYQHNSTHKRYSIAVDPGKKILYIYDQIEGLLYKKTNREVVLLDSLNRQYIDDTQIHYDKKTHTIVLMDAGLGRVFNYDLKERKLKRVDRSYRLRSFYGAKIIYEPGNHIIAYGGIGEFDQSNKLITFNVDVFNEWAEVQVDMRPNRFEDAISLFIDKVRNQYYLFTSFEDELYVYTLPVQYIDREQNIYSKPIEHFEYENWTLEQTFIIEKGNFTGFHHDNHLSNYKWLDDRINILGNFFYEPETGALFEWDQMANIHGIYADFNESDSLIVVSSTYNQEEDNPFNYKMNSYDIDAFYQNEQFIHYETKNNSQTFIIKWVVIISVLLGSIGFFTLARKKVEIPSIPVKKNNNTIQVSDSHVRIVLSSGDVFFYDEELIRLWRIIEQLNISGINNIEIELLDEKLFNGNSHKTYKTTKRNQLIDEINNKLGLDFLIKEKSTIDKRRKRLVVNFDLL